ncbi:bifunctional homocysteine S-methyltransferase/methylenetetrahydrofolate reductase [Clostridium cellulovorans]|uniref:Homocysteine S-methyltransferase n=1 Tax=Clostridium cellulovorans (strain ATCC 35296 / DSM 3052 / OCM 3 / 743B) TaxID=573061 RepID=D9SQZ1_CLOC7|nr:bifunctional homocysteine S-methyltransferase/methylenetetrahydrofolate reductase [Clostridium cellulovorans]ADL50279.1 homocysteine S-methyltransferase [Clostridium cellulovorans 743B]
MNLNERLLIFDGAMGTYYASSCNNPLPKCELANIHDKKTILNIHKEYIKAGAGAIKTNTFGANKISLECDFDVMKEAIVSGYEIAKEATEGTDVLVFADIGPIPFLEKVDLWVGYKEIIDIFLSLGASNFIFETFSSDEYLIEISEYIKEKNSKAFILTEFAVSPEGVTRLGKSGKKLLNTMLKAKTIDACGFNCFSGPYHLLQYSKTLDIKDKTISMMPNSGYPSMINNRVFFDNTKEYFAEQMLEIARQGVTILGGCCGTTPEYIKEMVDKLKGLEVHNILNDGRQIETTEGLKQEKLQEKKALTEEVKDEKRVNKNPLLEKLERGEKIIAVELDPPINTEIDFFISGAKRLKGQGIDAITIADCPIARARVDSSLLACKLKRELDITAIPHMTCRDRNINATKALLLGLNVEGINNVLVVTGDPIPSADREEIKGVFSFNSSILSSYIRELNETTFSSPFNVCGALNLNVRNFSNELEKAQKKIDNGITMFLTQPVLTEEAMENLKLARKKLNAKILGGIIPVVSYRNACFMNNEISGINVSEEIIERYKDVSKEEATRLAVEISTGIATEMSSYVDGFYIITPFKRIDIVSEIVSNIKNNIFTYN